MDMHEEGQEDQGPGRRERLGGKCNVGQSREAPGRRHIIFTMLEAPGSAAMSSQQGKFHAFHAFNAFR